MKRLNLFKKPIQLHINHSQNQLKSFSLRNPNLFSLKNCNYHTLKSRHTNYYHPSILSSNKYLYNGIYRKFTSNTSESSKKSDKKKKKSKESPVVQPPPPTEPIGDSNAEAKIQHVPKSGELSTFVVIVQKTQEGLSLIYIFGILLVCLPYTLYLVFKSLFSSSGADQIRNETFDLIKDDPRIHRILGTDVIARQVSANVNFLDDDGCERVQVIYDVQGSKGSARVDVEKINENGGKKKNDWRMQYCIVSTQYSVITIVDNRPLLQRPHY